jgi:hypothetical protein
MKFSIRDLLLVTVIVALAVGWWVDRSRLATGQQLLQAKEQLWKNRAEALLELYGSFSNRTYRWPADSSLAPEEVKP